MTKVVKVRYIKNDEYAYNCEDPKKGMFVWCQIKDPRTGQEYEQLAIITKVCDAIEAHNIKSELERANKTLKTARRG